MSLVLFERHDTPEVLQAFAVEVERFLTPFYHAPGTNESARHELQRIVTTVRIMVSHFLLPLFKYRSEGHAGKVKLIVPSTPLPELFNPFAEVSTEESFRLKFLEFQEVLNKHIERLMGRRLPFTVVNHPTKYVSSLTPPIPPAAAAAAARGAPRVEHVGEVVDVMSAYGLSPSPPTASKKPCPDGAACSRKATPSHSEKFSH